MSDVDKIVLGIVNMTLRSYDATGAFVAAGVFFERMKDDPRTKQLLEEADCSKVLPAANTSRLAFQGALMEFVSCPVKVA